MGEQYTNFFDGETVPSVTNLTPDTQPAPAPAAPAAPDPAQVAPVQAPAAPQLQEGVMATVPAQSSQNVQASADPVLAALKAENEALNRIVQNQFQQQPQQPFFQQPQQPAVPRQIQAIQNLADEDYISGQQLKQIVGGMMGELSQSALGEVQMAKAAQSERIAAMAHPDYNDVVQKYLPGVLRSQAMIDAIKADPDPAEFAYNLAKTNPEYAKDMAAKQTQQVAQKIQQNLTQQSSIAAAPAAVTQTQTPDDEAAKIRNMSDADFEAYVRSRRGY